MKGIRPKGRCGRCGGRFLPHEGPGYACPACLTTPARFQIDFSHKGRIRRERDLTGRPLVSFGHALGLLAEARRQIEAGTFERSAWVSGGCGEFRAEALMDRWLGEADVSLGYRAQLASVIKNHFIPVFRGMDVREIRTSHIENLLRGDTAASTRSTHLQMLRGFFRWLREQDKAIGRAPEFPKLKVQQRAVRLMDRATQLRLLKLIPREHQPIFTFLFHQACRPAEARALQWDCLLHEHVTYRRGFSGGKVVEYTRDRELRVNYLFPMVRAAIPRWTDSPFVFTHLWRGRDVPYSHAMLERIYKEALLKLNGQRAMDGLEPLSIPLYRATKHSGGAHLHQSENIPLETLRRWMGHSGPSSTERYARAIQKEKKETAVQE